MKQFLAALLLVFATSAFAQRPTSLLDLAREAPDLTLPAQPSVLTDSSEPELALYKPDGAGPFPALVLMHACGGLRSGNWRNTAITEWARAGLKRGYVVLVMDSLGPRNVTTRGVCYGPQNGVNFQRGVRDALQAAGHLRKFSFVDKDRIALMGFSWGAMVTTLAAGKTWARTLSPGGRFAAGVAAYPGCEPLGRGPTAFEVVSHDIDQPLLMLLGEKDTETPAQECIPRLAAARTAGAPVEFHVYPQATHCWDCKNLHNRSRVDVRGTTVTYLYDEAVTQDTERRAFDFLERVLAPKR